MEIQVVTPSPSQMCEYCKVRKAEYCFDYTDISDLFCKKCALVVITDHIKLYAGMLEQILEKEVV
jgi:hypothetical protein